MAVGHRLQVRLLVLLLHLLEHLDHVLAVRLQVDLAAGRDVACWRRRVQEGAAELRRLDHDETLPVESALGAVPLVHVAGLGARRLVLELPRDGAGGRRNLVDLRGRPTQLHRLPEARLHLVVLQLLRPPRINLSLHPAAIQLHDGRAISEIVEPVFGTLQIPELRKVDLVD